MAYVLIFLALALVIGPVLWLRPSPAERRKNRIRQQAIESGMKVSLLSAEDKDPWREQGINEQLLQQDMVIYRLPWDVPVDDLDAQTFERYQGRYVLTSASQWLDETGEAADLPQTWQEQLSALQQQETLSVWGLDITRCGVGLIWGEDAEPKVLSGILHCLQSIRAEF